MRKRPLQDVVSKSIRSPSHVEVSKVTETVPVRHWQEDTEYTGSKPVRKKPQQSRHFATKRKKPLFLLVPIIVVFVAVSIGAYIWTTFLASATVHIEPKTAHNIELKRPLIATKNATTDNHIIYTTEVIESSESITIEATTKKDTADTAMGEITIFNDHSDEPQRLLKNTRFENSKGLVYRVRTSTLVPGKTTDSQGNSTPGSIDVTVYAQEPGEEYNIEDTDEKFTIPGFEGTDKFETFSARIKTPILGGFKGSKLSLEKEAEENLRKELQKTLRSKIQSQAREAYTSSDDILLYEEAMLIEYSSLPTIENDIDTIEINERAKATIILFEPESFAKAIAYESIPEYNGSSIVLKNPEELTLEIKENDQVSSTTSMSIDTYRVHIDGTADIEWLLDDEAIQTELAGTKKATYKETLSQKKEIASAVIRMLPPWKQHFPEEASKIHIRRQ